MIWTDRLGHFATLDIVALAGLILCWLWIGWRIESPRPGAPSVSALMNRQRQDWMIQMVTRQPRMFDAQVINIMRQGTAFFASATMVVIGAGLALIGNPEPLQMVAGELARATTPHIVWEIKLLPILIFLANAFLKFVWAHRLFGYCAIIMAGVPNDPEDPAAYPRADQAAQVSINGARAFNKGMRAVYFALAATAWLAGALPLIAATLITLAMLYRREFASRSREILLQTPRNTQS